MQIAIDSSGFPQNPIEGTLFAKNDVLYIYRNVNDIVSWHHLTSISRLYQHIQSDTSQVWIVSHNFNLNAVELWVQVVSQSGQLLSGLYESIDNNTIQITLATSDTGYAIVIPKVHNSVSSISSDSITVGKVQITSDGIQIDNYPVLTTESITPESIGAISTDKISQAGGVASLNYIGVVPKSELPDDLVYLTNEGLLDPSLWPERTVFQANSDVGMLILPAKVGDLVLRPDILATFVLAMPQANMLSAWWRLPTPSALVSSVNGMTGDIVIDTVPNANKLSTPRTINLSGLIQGTASFDGSSNININTSRENLSLVAVTGSFNDLINRPLIPTTTSGLVNDTGFITINQVPVSSVNGMTGNVTIAPYTLPIASTTRLGGIKAGTGVQILADGTLNVTGEGTGNGVLSVNGRDGAVILDNNDITFALGFTPYSASNPNNFQTLSQVISLVNSQVLPIASDITLGVIKQGNNVEILTDGTLNALPTGVLSFNGRDGDVELTFDDIRIPLLEYPDYLFSLPITNPDDPKLEENISRIWMWQLKYTLLSLNLLDTVQDYLDDEVDPLVKQQLLIKWNSAPTIRLGTNIAEAIKAALSYTDEQILQLFIQANLIDDEVIYEPEDEGEG